jgi:hypothetical protein
LYHVLPANIASTEAIQFNLQIERFCSPIML